MAGEISSLGVKFGYAVETTAGTRPTTFTDIPDVKSIPAIDSTREGLDCTPLSETMYRRYVQGLADPGNDFAIVANDTTAFRTAWNTLVSADEALTGGKVTWFCIEIPDRDKFYLAGKPSPLGWNGAEVNTVQELTAHITPSNVVGYASA